MKRRDALLGIGLLAAHSLANTFGLGSDRTNRQYRGGFLATPSDRRAGLAEPPDCRGDSTESPDSAKYPNCRSADRIVIKIWQTPAASSHRTADDRTVGERAAEFLERALAAVGRDVDVTYADRTIAFDCDDSAIGRVAWPRRVIEGAAGLGPVDPVRDVNLLLTDGAVDQSPSGYAYDHVATVPGAGYLAEMPGVDDVDRTVDYSAPAAVAHLVLHEVGHALGLHHRHGSVDVTDAAVTASPMLSGYVWGPSTGRENRLHSEICGGEPTIPDGRQPRLSMSYAPCAGDALRAYDGPLER